MGKHKRRYVTRVGEDRISNLPEHLIDSILERVPFEDAVKTSIISKKSRYKWTSMKVLTFDNHFNAKIAKNGAIDYNEYISTINQVLNLHKGPISKFVIHIPPMLLDSFEEIDEWMMLLSRNNVTKLVLYNSNRRYELPSHVYSCLGLTELILENCNFNPPLQFEGFLNLEELFLEHIDFGENLSGNQINLPQLKNLSFRECMNVHNFNIKATKMKSLILVTCPDANLLQLLENPSIVVFGVSFRTFEDFDRFEMINSISFLSSLTRIEDFLIEGNFLKFLSTEEIPKWLPLSMNSLKRLELQDFEVADLDQLHVALCLLRNSPNLDTLRVHFEEPRYFVGLALDHFKAANCLDYTLKQLRTVEITCLEGLEVELLFIKLLLAHSPNLENISITPIGRLTFRRRFAIARHVMSLPRASPKAVIIYLNPEK
ncbi:F-box/FBD/LRR-repeat protein At1g13570-like [Lactuca sativa]|uniref:F-box domain-containing protein n=1 Tax=Lactuca sativa TaxID=4236 RepID=A0A9R1WP53_LACSA|nr:F-box/FBD/LRR-repeat protein At1g13570-like [Lactuca sativa]KAJ0226290.1 hypothetical protein LSAT_V11C100032670 [Lactuca sativa]